MESLAPNSSWSPPFRALTIGILLALGLVAFESLAVSTVMPRVAHDLNGLNLYGWAFSLFQLANIIGIFWAGQTADRRGPAFPFAVALSVFLLGLVCSSLAVNMPMLLLGRVFQGWGAGVVATVIYVVVQLGYPPHLRASMLASLSAAWILPTLVGPLLASFLADHLTWRAVFWVLIPLVLPSLLLTLPALARLRPGVSSPKKSTLPMAVVLAIGTTLMLAGLSAHNASSPFLLVGGIGLMAMAFPHLFPPGILQAKPGVPAGVVLRACMLWSFVGFEAFLPLGLTELRQVSLQTAALTLMAGSLSWSVGSWIQARLEALHGRPGRPVRIRLGFSMIFLGCLLVALTILPLGFWVGFAACGWLIVGLGMGVCFAAITLEVLEVAKEDEKGTTSSWLQSGDVLASALSAGLMGTVLVLGGDLGWARANSYVVVFVFLLSAPILGFFVSGNLQRSTPVS